MLPELSLIGSYPVVSGTPRMGHLCSTLCPVLWPLMQGRPALYRSPVHYRQVLAHSWKRGCIPRLPSRRVWRSFLGHPLFRLHQQFRSCCLTSCSRSTALERPFRQPVRFLQFWALPVSPSWTSRVPLTFVAASPFALA